MTLKVFLIETEIIWNAIQRNSWLKKELSNCETTHQIRVVIHKNFGKLNITSPLAVSADWEWICNTLFYMKENNCWFESW